MIADNAEAVIGLASRLGDAMRPSLSPTEWNRFATVMADLQTDLSETFTEGFEIRDVPGISETIATKVDLLSISASAAVTEAADLKHRGITTTTIVDGAYPDCFRTRLGNLAPPVIYTVGNTDLLTGDGVGIVGSRNVTEEGKAVAESIATEAARHGRNVVSGGARGVDSFAMNAAFVAGGAVIGVLADSLLTRIRRPGTLKAIDDGTVCLLSQQIPSAGFTPHSAMARNKLIYALSAVTVVVATDHESGGTWAGATEALKKGNGDVAVWVGEGSGPGNAALVSSGARAVRTLVDLLSHKDSKDPAEQLAFG